MLLWLTVEFAFRRELGDFAFVVTTAGAIAFLVDVCSEAVSTYGLIAFEMLTLPLRLLPLYEPYHYSTEDRSPHTAIAESRIHGPTKPVSDTGRNTVP